MSLYHSHDKKFRDLRESWKKVQEVSREEHDALVNKALAAQGTKVYPKADMSEYPEIPGLEGPFQYPDGRILYYDPKEGKYYDRRTDMYIDHEDSPMKEAGEYLADNVESMFRKAYELMKKVERIYDADPKTIEEQREAHKVLMAMEEMHQLIFDDPGSL